MRLLFKEYFNGSAFFFHTLRRLSEKPPVIFLYFFKELFNEKQTRIFRNEVQKFYRKAGVVMKRSDGNILVKMALPHPNGKPEIYEDVLFRGSTEDALNHRDGRYRAASKFGKFR